MTNLHRKCQLLLMALSLLILNNCNMQEKNVEEKQNILFIAVDDMNDWAGFLSGHSGMKIHTPNIDRLAASSMAFTQCSHTGSGLCPDQGGHTYGSTSRPFRSRERLLGGWTEMAGI